MNKASGIFPALSSLNQNRNFLSVQLSRCGLLIVLAFLLSCEQPPVEIEEQIEVTLVEEFCGQAILKIEDPNFYHLGESANGEENVFYTMLTCEDMGIQTEQPFSVRLVDSFDPGDCAVCLGLLSYDGDKRYYVELL